MFISRVVCLATTFPLLAPRKGLRKCSFSRMFSNLYCTVFAKSFIVVTYWKKIFNVKWVRNADWTVIAWHRKNPPNGINLWTWNAFVYTKTVDKREASKLSQDLSNLQWKNPRNRVCNYTLLAMRWEQPRLFFVLI